MQQTYFCIILLAIFLMLPIITIHRLEPLWNLIPIGSFKKVGSEKAYTVDFDDSKWENVTVPHDWAIYGPFDKEVDKQLVKIEQNKEEVATEKTGRTGALPHIGQAWYRNKFSLARFREVKRSLFF